MNKNTGKTQMIALLFLIVGCCVLILSFTYIAFNYSLTQIFAEYSQLALFDILFVLSILLYIATLLALLRAKNKKIAFTMSMAIIILYILYIAYFAYYSFLAASLIYKQFTWLLIGLPIVLVAISSTFISKIEAKRNVGRDDDPLNK